MRQLSRDADHSISDSPDNGSCLRHGFHEPALGESVFSMDSRLNNDCWFLEAKDAPIFVLLGRTGDSIALFPAFREIQRRTGLRPRVIVSTDYSNIYEGITYAEPIPLAVNWWEGVPQARAMAAALSAECCVPQWWNDPCPIPPEYRGTFNLTCHGKSWGVNLALWSNYMASMWERCGFTQDEMMRLPLIFDRRNREREAALFKQHTGVLRKPLLLYSFTGISSPFPYVPEVVNALHREFSKDFAFLDIGRIQAHRIFDLLTFYDRAVGLIVSDSAPAHLAVASKVPTIWLTVNGWTGSTPRGNVALHVEYNDVPGRLPEILATVGKWRHTPVNAESRLQPV